MKAWIELSSALEVMFAAVTLWFINSEKSHFGLFVVGSEISMNLLRVNIPLPYVSVEGVTSGTGNMIYMINTTTAFIKYLIFYINFIGGTVIYNTVPDRVFCIEHANTAPSA